MTERLIAIPLFNDRPLVLNPLKRIESAFGKSIGTKTKERAKNKGQQIHGWQEEGAARFFFLKKKQDWGILYDGASELESKVALAVYVTTVGRKKRQAFERNLVHNSWLD